MGRQQAVAAIVGALLVMSWAWPAGAEERAGGEERRSRSSREAAERAIDEAREERSERRPVSGREEAAGAAPGPAAEPDAEPDADLDTEEPMRPLPVVPVPVPGEREGRSRDHLITSFGTALTVGGGVVDFTDDAMQDLADLGGSWDARFTFGTRQLVALEAAYVGSAQSIDAVGIEDDSVLVSNGAEGTVRVNVGTYDIEPFVFGGGAWRRYDLVDAGINTSNIDDGDNVFEVPVGGGVAVMYRGFLLDARYTYRFTLDEDLVRSPTGSSADVDLDNWSVTGRAGFEF